MLSFFHRRDTPRPSVMRKRRYRFEPRPDITAYELALILKGIHAYMPTTGAMIGDIEVDPLGTTQDWLTVSRHFVLID